LGRRCEPIGPAAGGRLRVCSRSPAEHAMMVDKVPLAAEADNAQKTGHSAFAGCQHGPDEQDFGMA
jgi:hypothetical protein